MMRLVVLLVLLGAVFAHGDADGSIDAKDIIEQGTPCSQLSDAQLEAIGEYYMEQMHPGEQHTMMDNMMGGEGSESLRQAHINMAQRIYCGQWAPSPHSEDMTIQQTQRSFEVSPAAYLVAGLVLGGLAVFLLRR